MLKQKTISKAVTLSGIGLHTGENIEVSFQPAPVNHGFVFQRVDLEGQPLIEAHVDNVVDTSRSTVLGKANVRVGTVEHSLAALAGLEIDNVLISVNGPEMPILDGSAKLYVKALKEAGIIQQEADKNYYEIKENINYSVEEHGIELIVMPSDKLELDVMIDYNSSVLGNQYARLEDIADFEKEISECKTFVFFKELEFLLKNNLIKGGSLDNALVILERKVSQEELDRITDLFNKPRMKVRDQGILNNTDLIYSNEPARHKLLDLLGDLTLVGMPFKGKIIARKPGHQSNVAFARKIVSVIENEQKNKAIPSIDYNKPPLLDINQIKEILPHRPPFLLVDRIISMDEKAIVGVKNVTMNESFFNGHFPEEPVMPGVLIVEAMAQCGGILVLNTVDNPKEYSTYFLKIDSVKFKKKVTPGDSLVFKNVLIKPIRRGVAYMHGQVFVGNQLVAEGNLLAQIVKNK